MNIKIPEQILSAVNKMDQKYRYYFFGGGLILIFLADYFFLMWPQMKSLNKISADNKVIFADIGKAKEDIQRQGQYEEQLAKARQGIDAMLAKIRLRDEIPLILEQITRLANDNGVRIDQIMPGAQNAEIVLEDEKRKYLSIPITIEARGGYHDFGRFLNQLERQKNFLHVETFSIAVLEDSVKHAIKLTLMSVVLEEGGFQP